MDKPQGAKAWHRKLFSNPVINHNGKKYEKVHRCICMTESLCSTKEINIVNQLYFINFLKKEYLRKNGSLNANHPPS